MAGRTRYPFNKALDGNDRPGATINPQLRIQYTSRMDVLKRIKKGFINPVSYMGSRKSSLTRNIFIIFIIIFFVAEKILLKINISVNSNNVIMSEVRHK